MRVRGHTAALVRQNDEGTYERLRAAQAEEWRRQEAARAAEDGRRGRRSEAASAVSSAQRVAAAPAARAAAAREAHERCAIGLATAREQREIESDGAFGRRPGVFADAFLQSLHMILNHFSF